MGVVQSKENQIVEYERGSINWAPTVQTCKFQLPKGLEQEDYKFKASMNYKS